MDWDRCLDILAAYRVIPRTLQLFETYWDRLTNVDRASGYFGLPFKGYRLVTQGDPFNPKLVNVVM